VRAGKKGNAETDEHSGFRNRLAERKNKKLPGAAHDPILASSCKLLELYILFTT
jgi:hypothetical protein